MDGSDGGESFLTKTKVGSLPGESALSTGKSKSHRVTNLLFLQRLRSCLGVPAEEVMLAFSFCFILLECAGRI